MFSRFGTTYGLALSGLIYTLKLHLHYSSWKCEEQFQKNTHFPYWFWKESFNRKSCLEVRSVKVLKLQTRSRLKTDKHKEHNILQEFSTFLFSTVVVVHVSLSFNSCFNWHSRILHSCPAFLAFMDHCRLNRVVYASCFFT